MKWWWREKRLKELSVIMNTQTGNTLDAELEALSISLENVSAVRQMAGTEGWAIISEQLSKFAAQQCGKIIAGAADPVGNEKELLLACAMRYTAEKLLKLVNNTLKESDVLERRQKELLQAKHMGE